MRGVIGGGYKAPVLAKVEADSDAFAEDDPAAEALLPVQAVERAVIHCAAEACLDEDRIEDRKGPCEAGENLACPVVGGLRHAEMRARAQEHVEQVVFQRPQ